MTVAKFIEWLKTQDQDAVVHVVFHEAGYGYDNQGGTARTVVFDPNNHSERYEKELLREQILGIIGGINATTGSLIQLVKAAKEKR